ncbi:MAG: hypothetical protein RIR70_1449 [Pseudomonadota bacterium]|jgi:hypothetical protein
MQPVSSSAGVSPVEAPIASTRPRALNAVGRKFFSALMFGESVVESARDLCDLAQGQPIFFVNNAPVFRSEIEPIASGVLPPSLEERRERDLRFRAQQALLDELGAGWAPNVHLGSLLSTGALALAQFRRANGSSIPNLPATTLHIQAQIQMQRRLPQGQRQGVSIADQALAGLDFMLSQCEPVNEAGLVTDIVEVLIQVWTYASRHADPGIRQNLMSAFVDRLVDIHHERPCATGCVQRLLQVPEGVDPTFSSDLPEVSDLHKKCSA